jgi:triacylglycerol lipase
MSINYDQFLPLNKTADFDLRNARSLCLASHLAYKNEKEIKSVISRWGFDLHRFHFMNRQYPGIDTQGFIATNDDSILIAFRGTEKVSDWVTDLQVSLAGGPFGKIHEGFLAALYSVLWDLIESIDRFRNGADPQPLWFTGHSLGAAIATVAVAKFREMDRPVRGLYTFGSPRVGNRQFEQSFNADFKHRTFRLVHGNDVISRIPTRSMGYSHVGIFYYLDPDGGVKRDPTQWELFLDRITIPFERFKDPNYIPSGIDSHSLEEYFKCLNNEVLRLNI